MRIVILYRKLFKRFYPIHLMTHWLMRYLVLPGMERLHGFQTMPDDPFWFRLALLTQQHEVETVQQMEKIIQEGMVVLDIGAHVGYYTRRFARWVGERGQVIAFEPHPRTFKTLQSNTRHFKNVYLAQVALAEEEGIAELYDYLMMSASGSLHYDENMRDLQRSSLSKHDIAPRIASDFPMEAFQVRTTSVDTYLSEIGVQKVNVVKMDIEGAELGALRGMRQLIQDTPDLVIIMEYNPQALKAFNHDPLAALDEILEMGFRNIQIVQADGTLRDVTHQRDYLRELTDSLMQNMGVVNLLLTQ